METARDSVRPVVVHASTAEAIRRAVRAGAETIEHGDEAAHGVLKFMVQRGNGRDSGVFARSDNARELELMQAPRDKLAVQGGPAPRAREGALSAQGLGPSSQVSTYSVSRGPVSRPRTWMLRTFARSTALAMAPS
jgi:hypothetical protein